MDSSDLPTWDDTRALLIGIGEAGQVQRWRPRWDRLNGLWKRRRAQTKPVR